MNYYNQMNNHFNLDIMIPSITDLCPIYDILYPRHIRSNDKIFAFIKDRVTFIVDEDFEISKGSVLYLEKFQTL